MRKQIELGLFLKRIGPGGCSYNGELKAEFHRLAMAALAELEQLLGFKSSNRRWNAGGIAVSGDACLMGMWSENCGVYISINNDISLPCGDFMYRSITHLRDFSGGGNRWASFGELGTQGLVEKILNLKGDDL